MHHRRSSRPRQPGQALVVLALTMTVILAATAVVMDGGNAMAQQRGTQNATDSAALAGATVIAEKMGGVSRTDSDVVAAMSSAFSGNTSTMGTSYYITFAGNLVGTVGRGGPIPSDASGIQAAGMRTFNTFMAAIAGQSSWTAGASASALAGALRSICSAMDGCGVMPITYSIPITSCDGTSRPLRIGVDWPLVSLQTALDDHGVGNYESIVPLCKNGPGGVGFLEMGCGGNLSDQITTPCNGPFDIPAWIQTSSGNANNVGSELNPYEGEVILIPMFDATCREVPSTGLPADCTDPGDGSNLWYHIPRFAMFLLDEAYVQGSNFPQCNQPPGQPLVGGNGSTACLKGWFVHYIMQGRVGSYEGCPANNTDCLEPILGVQLVR